MEDLQKDNALRFKAFFMKNYPRVKAFAWKMLRNEDDAEDIAQDIFTKLWAEPDLWKKHQEWDSYLFTMVRNMTLNFINHQAFEADYAERAADKLSELQDSIPGLDDELHAKELQLLIKMEIERMPRQRKQIFLLSREKGLSNPEIAERLGLSIRTVERHIYLALQELKKIITFFIFFRLFVE